MIPISVAELPEVKDWPQLGEFLSSMNRIDWLMTIGCLATAATPGEYDVLHVDIAFSGELRFSEEACEHLLTWLLALGQCDGSDITMEVCTNKSAFSFCNTGVTEREATLLQQTLPNCSVHR